MYENMNERQLELASEMFVGFTKLQKKKRLSKAIFEDLIGLHVSYPEMAEIFRKAGFDVTLKPFECRVNLSVREMNQIGSHARLSNNPFYYDFVKNENGSYFRRPYKLNPKMRELLKWFNDAQAQLFLYTAEITGSVPMSLGSLSYLPDHLNWDDPSDRILIDAFERMGVLD